MLVMNFDKTGYQLTAFPLQPSTSHDANHGNGSVLKRIRFCCFKICMGL